MKTWPFKVVDDNSKPKIQVEYKGETKTFFPEEVSNKTLAVTFYVCSGVIVVLVQSNYLFILGRLFIETAQYTRVAMFE